MQIRHDTTLDYSKHFVLLTAVAAAIVLAGRWRPAATGVMTAFGGYGALYASTVVFTSNRPMRWWSKSVFISSSAALCMLTVFLGLSAGRYTGLAGVVRGPLVLAAASGFGAVAFALCVRCLLKAEISLRATTAIATGCALATVAALLLGRARANAGLWLALAWWYAFSMGLWLNDRRSAQRPSGRREG